jgi:hypothetical protein
MPVPAGNPIPAAGPVTYSLKVSITKVQKKQPNAHRRLTQSYLQFQICSISQVFCKLEKRNAYRLFVGKPEKKRPLGRQRRRWVDNIRMYLVVIVWCGVYWIVLAHDMDKCRAFVSTLMYLRVL